MPAPFVKISDELLVNWWSITWLERAKDGRYFVHFAGDIVEVTSEEYEQLASFLADSDNTLATAKAHDETPADDARSRFQGLVHDP